MDDFVVCFQHKWEAERFYERLKHRMEYFGLSLEERKKPINKVTLCTMNHLRCRYTRPRKT